MTSIVVGAGTAGCLVARRLVEAGRDVVVVEAGAGRPFPTTVESVDWMRAQREPGRTWEGLMARRSAAAVPAPYLRGRGLGGSSAINGMLATFGPRASYDQWEELGLGSSDRIDDAIERVEADNPTIEIDPGPFAARVAPRLTAAGWEVARAPLAATHAGGGLVRRSAAHYLEDVAHEGLRIQTGFTVAQIEIVDGTATGVRAADGTLVEGDEVIVSAGSVHSPAMLLRSGIGEVSVPAGRQHQIGAGAADHPSVAFTVELDASIRTSTGDARQRPPITLMAERNGVHVLVMDYVLDHDSLGVVTVALLDPASTGRVEIDPAGEPLIDLELLTHADDRARLAEASAEVRELFESADGVSILSGPHGADLDHHLGPYSHLTSSCAVGRVLDERGTIHGGPDRLRVIDSAALPNLPPTNPMLPTLVLAELLAGAA